MDTDNPLAATLAAVRAYVTHRNGYDPKRDGEPYPLLLVRPDGIIAYAVARAAIKASYTEFGYELIGADWKLRFPDPDLGLARAASGALADARVRQRRLIATMPPPSRRGSKPVYRVLGNGEILAEGGSSSDEPQPDDHAQTSGSARRNRERGRWHRLGGRSWRLRFARSPGWFWSAGRICRRGSG